MTIKLTFDGSTYDRALRAYNGAKVVYNALKPIDQARRYSGFLQVRRVIADLQNWVYENIGTTPPFPTPPGVQYDVVTVRRIDNARQEVRGMWLLVRKGAGERERKAHGNVVQFLDDMRDVILKVSERGGE